MQQVVGSQLPPNPFTHISNFRKLPFDSAQAAANLAFRYPHLTSSAILPPGYLNQFHR